MSLQTIINHAETLEIDRRRVVGVQFTRNEIAKTSETPTRNPWKFNVGISAALVYSENRQLLEAIDLLDRTTPEIISFNSLTTSSVPGNSNYVGKTASAGLNYIFAYQGDVRLADGITPNYSLLNNMSVQSFNGNQLVLTTLPGAAQVTGGQNAIMFKAGDFIQIQGYPFPFTNRYDVKLGTGTSITLTTHRPNFITGNVVGAKINVGNQCQFQMFCQNMPTYKLTSGGPNAIINWSSEFKLYEYTGNA